MRILVCNDDGIAAPGLARLVEAASEISDDIWVVAPDAKRTAAGSSLTIAKPLTIECTRPGWYACSGTPADCVVSAMTWLFQGKLQPDLVLSGINDGRNVAEDLAYSGTLGIAREASFWGLPSVGFSRVKNPEIGDTDTRWMASLIKSLSRSRCNWAISGHWLSVNLPNALPAKIRQPRIGQDKIARTADVVEVIGERTIIKVPRGREHASQPGDENAAIDAGFATINRLNWFGETRLTKAFLESVND